MGLKALHHAHVAHVALSPTPANPSLLAVQLDIPLYANDPALNHLGTKSGCREVFRDAGILFPDGFENLQRLEKVEAGSAF